MNLPTRYKPTGTHFGGGQGVVTIWDDTFLGRKVAVKVLSTRGIGGSLRDEAALLGAIKSKHVVELFEVGTDPASGKDFMIMEFVSGPRLEGFRPSTLNDLFLALYQIACGMADIHAANCIHRDLKPDNLRRDGANIIKIIDFGLGANTNPANTNSGRGTDGYRGPEYFLSPIQLTPATDVYALGVIAHEFCFGAINAALLKAPPDTPPIFATALIGTSSEVIPSEIANSLDACFARNTTKRPTAAHLSKLFAKYLLRGQHRANFVHQGQMYTVSQSASNYRITASKGSFDVSYNGLDFILKNVGKEVFVNNSPASEDMRLPHSCVITIGAGKGIDRAFIPFDVSHPEVVL